MSLISTLSFSSSTRTFSLALLTAASAALIACSGAPSPAPSGDETSSQVRGGNNDNKSEDNLTADAGSTGKGSSSSSGGSTGSSGTGKGDADGGKAGGGKGDPGPVDPACVASCNSGLKAKCDGDEAFCEDVCASMPLAQVSCLVAAASCEKSEWMRCAQENPGPDPDPGTKGGK